MYHEVPSVDFSATLLHGGALKSHNGKSHAEVYTHSNSHLPTRWVCDNLISHDKNHNDPKLCRHPSRLPPEVQSVRVRTQWNKYFLDALPRLKFVFRGKYRAKFTNLNRNLAPFIAQWRKWTSYAKFISVHTSQLCESLRDSSLREDMTTFDSTWHAELLPRRTQLILFIAA